MALTKIQAVRGSCATKIQWPSRDLAEGHVLTILANRKTKDPSRLHTYRCPVCDWWHVGHSNRQER